ncbi:hypothetical protein NDU88_006793 [Pleurodeles waltl]|uniref:Uncharacterized protein n=1 Tax=Pleurodeles waltl TaxID=8319 RepID=A0AAV7X161_PLEWA|nr:hypothetical protein NDU88_006793 [Pleurodeles waltl]
MFHAGRGVPARPPSSAAPGAPAGPAPMELLRSGRRAALTSAPAARPPGRGSPRSPAPSGLPRAPPGKRRALTAQGRSRPESPGNRLTSRDRWCRHCGPPAPPPASRRGSPPRPVVLNSRVIGARLKEVCALVIGCRIWPVGQAMHPDIPAAGQQGLLSEQKLCLPAHVSSHALTQPQAG